MTILYHYFAERRSHICNNLLNMDMTPWHPALWTMFKNYKTGRKGHPLSSPLQLMEWPCQSFTEELNWWFSTLIRVMRWHAITATKTKKFAGTTHIDISIDIYFNTLALTVRHYTQLQTRKSIFNLTLVAPHCGFQDYELSWKRQTCHQGRCHWGGPFGS